MNDDKPGIARRDFLRIIGIAGLGFGLNRELPIAEAESSGFAAVDAKAKIIAGLEIGTSKICVAVGEKRADGIIKILGLGHATSRGVRKGEIVDIEVALKCVHRALIDAEKQSGVRIRSVNAGVTGSYITGFNNRGTAAISRSQEKIQENDLDAVRASARLVSIPSRDAFIHTVPQYYSVDQLDGVVNPIGMKGRKLCASFHIIHGNGERIRKTLICIKAVPVEIEDVVFNPLAGAQAVLDQDQKDLGALVIDYGAGTTDYLVYVDGAVKYSGSLAIGGDHVTNDLSIGLRISIRQAEDLKTREGSLAATSKVTQARHIFLKGSACEGSSEVDREVDREVLNEVIRCRVRETLEHVKNRLEASRARLDLLGAGMSLTGGCSRLPGINELAQEIFSLPTSRARARGFMATSAVLEDPGYSCALGLVKYGGARD